MTSSPTAMRPAGRKRSGLAVSCAMILCASVAALFVFGARPLVQYRAARSWPEVPCRIEASEVRSHRGYDATTYSVAISYTYAFGGQSYRSERYQFMSVRSGGRTEKEDIVAAYPPGGVQWCYVNPARPSEAVLSRDLPREVWFVVPGAIALIAASLLGLYAARRPATRRAPPPRPGSPSAA